MDVNLSRIAHTTGYSISHISRVFSGENGLSVTCLSKISSALDLTTDEVLHKLKEGEFNVRESR